MPKYKVSPIVQDVKGLLADFSKDSPTDPFLIPTSEAIKLVSEIYRTFDPETDILGATLEEFKAAIDYTSNQTTNKALKGKVYCFTNLKPKESSRFKENIRGKMFNDVNYDGRTDAKKAKEVAIDAPCLFLSFQKGNKDPQGWSGTEFYWPTLFIQKNLVTSIFTTDTSPGENLDEEDLTDDTGPMRK